MEELYYFVQVATLLSFSQVAQSMGVSQPAVSQKIKTLETVYLKEWTIYLQIRNDKEMKWYHLEIV